MNAATATSANGVWQYGELPDLTSPATSFGVYTLTTLTYDGVAGFSGYYATGGLPMLLGNFASPPATIVDGSVHLPVGFLEMHPGASGQYSAVRFVAPSSGTYGFAGQFQGQDSGGTSTDVHVLRIAEATSTSTSLFASAVNGFYGGDGGSPSGTSPIAPFDLSGVALAAGDSVLFVVGDGGGTYYADSTGLQVTATVGSSGSPAADDPFGYLGGLGYWQDPALADSGLSYVRQRWLENATGQWLSVDPVASEPRYGYAHNMPTMRVDPSGFQASSSNPSVFQKVEEAGASALHIIDNLMNPGKMVLDMLGPLAPGFEPYYRNAAESYPRTYREFQSEFAKFVPLVGLDFGNSQSAWETQRSGFLPPINDLAPPFYRDPQFVPYAAGFTWGLLSSVYHVLHDNPLTPIVAAWDQVVAFTQYLGEIADDPHIAKVICDKLHGAIMSALHSFSAFLGGVHNLSPYDRGKLAAILLANALLLILVAMDLPEAVEGLVQGGKEIFAAVKGAGSVVRRLLEDRNLLEELQEFLRGFGRNSKVTLQEKAANLKRAIKHILNSTSHEIHRVGPNMPSLPKSRLYIMREMQIVNRLAKIDLHGVPVDVRFLSDGMPAGVDIAKVQAKFERTPAFFTVSDTDYRAYLMFRDDFFSLSRNKQRVIIGHELAHGEQWAVVLRRFESLGYAKSDAHAFFAGPDQQGIEKAPYDYAIEFHAQRAGMRSVFPDLPAGSKVTENMAADAGVTDALKQHDRLAARAKALFDLLPENYKSLSFFENLFD